MLRLKFFNSPVSLWYNFSLKNAIYIYFSYDYTFLSILDLAAAISAVTRSREQMMREMVGYVLATEVTIVVWKMTVLRFGMRVEKLAHCYFSWVVCPKTENNARCFLRRQQNSGSALVIHSTFCWGESVHRGNATR